MRVGRLRVEILNPRPDRGAIRGTFTVREGKVIHFRSTLNLTSETARAKVLKKLAGRGVEVPEDVLIALDEACRRPTPARKPLRDSSPKVSDAPPLTFDEMAAVFGEWLLIEDDALLPVLAGAILAHRLAGDPVWLLVVAPPGGTKTELLRSLYGYPGIFPLSALTARTLASGLDHPEGDKSLLTRLASEILVLKDFTTVLEISHEERQAILAQLREVYDGRFDKVWGTGHEVHWQGRLGFLAGVTPVIDRHHAAMSVLGERFILVRPRLANRRRLAAAALAAAGSERAMRKALQQAMHGFLLARGSKPPALTEGVERQLVEVADFITRARSGVVREGYGRTLEYAPEPEAPTRFAKVLLSLASGIALAYDRRKVGARELRLVFRAALDCLPVIRREVVEILAGAPTTGLETSQVAANLRHCSPTYVVSVRRSPSGDPGAGIGESVPEGNRWHHGEA